MPAQAIAREGEGKTKGCSGSATQRSAVPPTGLLAAPPGQCIVGAGLPPLLVLLQADPAGLEVQGSHGGTALHCLAAPAAGDGGGFERRRRQHNSGSGGGRTPSLPLWRGAAPPAARAQPQGLVVRAQRGRSSGGLTCSLLCLLFKHVTPVARLRGTARSPRWAAPLPLSRCSQTRLPPACDRYPRDARCNVERSQLLRASDALACRCPDCRHAERGSRRHGETTGASDTLLASHAASLYSSCNTAASDVGAYCSTRLVWWHLHCLCSRPRDTRPCGSGLRWTALKKQCQKGLARKLRCTRQYLLERPSATSGMVAAAAVHSGAQPAGCALLTWRRIPAIATTPVGPTSQAGLMSTTC